MALQREELGKLALFVGAALIIAGLIRYNILNVWGWNAGFVAVGAALFIAGLVMNGSALLGFFTGRSGKLGTNTAVLSLAVIGLLVIANLLGYRHHKRIDLTEEKLYSLSDQTRNVVAKLPKDVKVIKFDKQENPGLKDLMAEYKGAGNRISYEFVDPESKPEIAKQYKVTKFGETVVAAGDRIEKIEATAVTEQELTNAILKITTDKLKTICFTEGHSERGLTDGGAEGFANAEKKLKAENYETKAVNLAAGAGQIPAECSVLVVAGPKTALLAPEVSNIGKYLDGGGKVMLAFDPDTDPQANDLLSKWNVELGNNTVLDVSAAGQLFGGGPMAPLVMNFGSHPITDKFGRSMTIFPLAREVKVGKASNTGVTTASLLTTSEQSWGETEIKAGVAPEYKDGTGDTKGPLTLAVAASKNLGENKEARLLVYGDSDFASNRALGFQKNTDLFLNSVNWLAQDESLISIRPKATTNRSVTMSESQQRLFFWLCVAFLPLVVMATGVYVWWRRR
ncbi:MAG: GldG family protein [Acidobacteria bacterium]|nr:GldG family protein [Acidobacteriota bacterium]